MKFIRNVILVIAIASGGLYYTNPGHDAFSAFLAEYVQVELADDTPGESELGQAFRKGLGQIAGVAGGQLAERQNLSLASVYTIKIAGTEHVFVGIAGQFFPVKAS
ncbi:MAG: hypothetical protein CL849_06085 [Crocinitomicaceae bacterium]|nr:hypothetical protein [Crocinitomicaceae bacterium]